MPFLPCVPKALFSCMLTLDAAGIFQLTQWSNVPLGASGSSTINTNVFAPLGTSLMVIGGFMLLPSQVYCCGISPLLVNAELDTVSVFSLNNASVIKMYI